jgi:hypothetical protein
VDAHGWNEPCLFAARYDWSGESRQGKCEDGWKKHLSNGTIIVKTAEEVVIDVEDVNVDVDVLH